MRFEREDEHSEIDLEISSCIIGSLSGIIGYCGLYN